MLTTYLRRKVHVSWMVSVGCVGIFVGIIAASMVSSRMFESIAWLLTGVTLMAFAVWRPKVWLIALVFAGGVLIGLWRGSLALSDLALYRQVFDTTTTVTGKISDDVDSNARNQSVIRLTNVRINNTQLAGTIWITSKQHHDIQRSDIVAVHGKIQEGFGSFAATMYDAKLLSVRRPEPGDIALKIRNWFGQGVEKALHEPQASLGLGYLVGQRRGLPEALDTALVAAGLTHVVVASGYNLTILVRLARRLFEKISKYLAFISSVVMITGFIAITGMSPSMSRAGLVAALSLVAWYYGRRFHPFVLLPLAIAITVLMNPSYAWGDLGWQLSFAAFAGVMIVAPFANSYFFGDKKERPLGRILVETISAQICTLPIILLAFGQTSAVAPIANVLILPLVPIAMLLTFIAGIGGIILPSVAGIIGLPAEIILSYMTQTILFFGSLPWAIQEIP
ncbi:TPA: hypothetical protein DIV49_01860, partial [Candidatus Saccharibacteria bacterium]|nr:hypothetical protein [Candidatus Saccharibacteria bacterium]